MKESGQLDLSKWEDPTFDADKDLKERHAKRKEEKRIEEEKTEANKPDYDAIHKFTKENEYYGVLCLTVSSYIIADSPILNETIEMKYQYEGMDNKPTDGAMSGTGGHEDLLKLDRSIHAFLRDCEYHKVLGKVFISKAAQDLINKWIESGRNYVPMKEDTLILKDVIKNMRNNYSPREEHWDALEWQAIAELGYEKGIEILKEEYKRWRRSVMEYSKGQVIKWQGMWTEHGPMDFYIEQVEEAVEQYNFHASRLGEPAMEKPDFLDRWKQEWNDLVEKRSFDKEKSEKESLALKKSHREEKSAARKKENEQKKAGRREELIKKYGTPFTDKMKACSTANEARDIISAYTMAFHDLEVDAMLPPTVGPDGSGCAYRGFSTLNKTEVKKAIKRLTEKNTVLGERLEALIIDIQESEPIWSKFCADEIGEMMSKIHGCDEKEKKVAA